MVLCGHIFTCLNLCISTRKKNERRTHRYPVLSYKYIRDTQMSSEPLNAASLAPTTETHRYLLEMQQPKPGNAPRTGASLSPK